jgi:hypothetical protein
LYVVSGFSRTVVMVVVRATAALTWPSSRRDNATTDYPTSGDPGRGEQTEADRRVRRPRQLGPQRRQRGADDVARRGGASPASGRSSKRSPWCCVGWSVWSTKGAPSTSVPDKPSSPGPANGSAIARRNRVAQYIAVCTARVLTGHGPSRRRLSRTRALCSVLPCAGSRGSALTSFDELSRYGSTPHSFSVSVPRSAT